MNIRWRWHGLGEEGVQKNGKGNEEKYLRRGNGLELSVKVNISRHLSIFSVSRSAAIVASFCSVFEVQNQVFPFFKPIFKASNFSPRGEITLLNRGRSDFEQRTACSVTFIVAESEIRAEFKLRFILFRPCCYIERVTE